MKQTPSLALPRGYTGEGTRRLLLTALVLIIGCDRPPAAPSSSRRIIVFATLYPLADIARQVGGDRVRADWLLDLGDPIDAYTLDRRDVTRMAGVDLILADGAGRTEIWARHALDRLRETGTLATVDQTPDAWRAPGDGVLALDPKLAGQYAHYLAKLFARRLPAEGDTFRRRATAFADEIDRATAGFSAPAGAQVVTLSPRFDPLLARLGIRPVLVSADPLRFTPRDADAVRRTAAEAGVRSLVVPFDTPAGTLAYLEELTGLKIITLDPLGYPNYQQHSTYLEVLRFNLDQLRLATSP